MAGTIGNLVAVDPLMKDEYKGARGPKKSARGGKKKSKNSKPKKRYPPASASIAKAMGAPC